MADVEITVPPPIHLTISDAGLPGPAGTPGTAGGGNLVVGEGPPDEDLDLGEGVYYMDFLTGEIYANDEDG